MSVYDLNLHRTAKRHNCPSPARAHNGTGRPSRPRCWPVKAQQLNDMFFCCRNRSPKDASIEFSRETSAVQIAMRLKCRALTTTYILSPWVQRQYKETLLVNHHAMSAR